MTRQHVLPDSIEIGEFRIDAGHLNANLRLVVCGRPESLVLFVEPLGEEIGVEVHESVLDFHALTVVAEHVAEKLNTVEGRAALRLAAEGVKQKRRRLPQVRVHSPADRCAGRGDRLAGGR
ncbi:MAG: hypothetical protein ABSE21_06390 [Bryobacteraceae bacterium]|jgi:hypothetical protein